MQLYDDFSTPQPDPDKWVVAEVRNGDQLLWRYEDANLKVACAQHRCSLDIPVFSSSNDQVPMFDNPKALYLSTESWDVRSQPVSFQTSIACEFSGDPDDYRDGFAAFNVLDFATGTVLDVIANGHHIWAICEQLDLPGVQTAVPPFTEVVDLQVPTAPLREHTVRIDYHPAEHWAKWYIDGVEKLHRDLKMQPERLSLAFGIITLHPLEGGHSTSIRGQGGKGMWGPFTVREAAAAEAESQPVLNPAPA
jgi:hypothetical protein